MTNTAQYHVRLQKASGDDEEHAIFHAPVQQPSQPAPNVSPNVVSTNPGSQSLTSASSRLQGPPSIQPVTPYAAVPPSLPVPPARPSRFCSPSFSRGPSRRTTASPARRRRRSRSPAQSSPAQAPDQSLSPGSSRLFCPVAACPDHAPPSHGWASFHSIRPHLEAHMAGQLLGEVPPEWLQSQGFGTCEVCQRILSLRYNGRCPSCFHFLTPSHDRPTDSRPLAEGAPTIWDVFTNVPRVRSSVPAGARDAWSRCLVIALSDIIAHRDTRSWTDLLTLPALVLAAPSRGGRRHTARADSDIRRRCLDWINGVRSDLWSPERGTRGKPRRGPDADRRGTPFLILLSPRFPP